MVESSPTARRSAAPSRLVLAVLLGSLALHAVALYTPGSPDLTGPVGSDKVVHLCLFGVPAALAVVAGGSWRRWLPPLLVAHAAVSELIQGAYIPHRAGDPWDAVADVIGVLLGSGVGALLAARNRGRPAPYAGVGDPG